MGEISDDTGAGLVVLRNHLRMAWRAHASAFFLLEDQLQTLEERRLHFKSLDPMFFAPESSAYLYLVSSRNFVRVAKRTARELQSDDLKRYGTDFDERFPGHKDGRDILEHFEDYGLGEGRLQNQGRRLAGEALTVSKGPRGRVDVRIYDCPPFDPSEVAYWIDGWSHFTEKAIFELRHPEEAWPGWRPDKWTTP